MTDRGSRPSAGMPNPSPAPEAWLRGPVDGVPAQLQPVAHALEQAMEDIERLLPELVSIDLSVGPGAAASAGFHLRHMAAALDRLLTYARAEPLSDAQRAELKAEKSGTPGATAEAMVERLREVVEGALDQLRSTADATLDDARSVGRAGYPSSVRGLLYHAGEHTARHAGQLITTVKALRG